MIIRHLFGVDTNLQYVDYQNGEITKCRLLQHGEITKMRLLQNGDCHKTAKNNVL